MSTDVVFTPMPAYDQIKHWEHPSFHARYARQEVVMDVGNPLVNHVLANFPTGPRVLVDVKVQELGMNHTTCQPGWHVDSEQDPEAVHHLFVLGENRTEFLINGEVVRLPEGHFASYGYDAQHRGPEVIIPETRVLIRSTESVRIMGNSMLDDHYPYTYPIGGKHVRV